MNVQEKAIHEVDLSHLPRQNGKNLIIEYVRRWGGLASDAVLDPKCTIFTLPHLEGLIGYRLEQKCAIVFGNPICAPNHLPELVHSFHSYCKLQHWNIIYISASEEFVEWALKNGANISIEFGEEVFIDPHHDPRDNTGNHASLVRRKVKHALHEGINTKEYLLSNSKIEKTLEQLAQSWLKSRAKKRQVYISHVRLFEDCYGKRWFYAHQNEKIIGVLVLNQLKKQHGWLLNRLMVLPDAPNGTSELLVISTLETLAKENCHFVTFGSVPLEQLGEIVGLNSLSHWMTKFIFKTADKFLHFSGHKKFWEKFHPQSASSYLLIVEPHLGLRESIGIMRALNVTF